MEANRQKAILLLEDGMIYEGHAAGKIGTTWGEICFNTGMTGYQEIFTDPSYFGQIVVCTNVHIGNYGIHNDEIESEHMKIAGLVCKNFTIPYSRPLANSSIQTYFEEESVVGIEGVDTRAIVRHIRSKGAMNAIISSENKSIDELRNMLSEVPSMDGLELSSKVTVEQPYFYGEEDAQHRVAVLDLGTKKNILRNFAKRNCYMKVFPAKTSFEEMKAWNPDGFFLSNGPGDPAAMDYAVETTRKILAEDYPLFGICLGHQILARAMGVPTYKMHFGHRGINHPVINLETGQCEITSQNHGFGVTHDALQKSIDKIRITHRNLNDDTVEGIEIIGKNAFSVQYHPEASPGPHDASYLFDQFLTLLVNQKSQVTA